MAPSKLSIESENASMQSLLDRRRLSEKESTLVTVAVASILSSKSLESSSFNTGPAIGRKISSVLLSCIFSCDTGSQRAS